jgi:hypothetical protein
MSEGRGALKKENARARVNARESIQKPNKKQTKKLPTIVYPRGWPFVLVVGAQGQEGHPH